MSNANGMSKAELERREYLHTSGKCHTCGHLMKSHPICEACTCLSNNGHEQSLVNFRGHKVCAACKKNWSAQDHVMKRKTTWEEFTKRSPKIQTEVLRHYERMAGQKQVKNIATGGR